MPRLIKVEKFKKPPYAARAYEGCMGLRLRSLVSPERKELAAIQTALETGAASYTLQYSVKCRQNLMRTIEE